MAVASPVPSHCSDVSETDLRIFRSLGNPHNVYTNQPYVSRKKSVLVDAMEQSSCTAQESKDMNRSTDCVSSEPVLLDLSDPTTVPSTAQGSLLNMAPALQNFQTSTNVQTQIAQNPQVSKNVVQPVQENDVCFYNPVQTDDSNHGTFNQGDYMEDADVLKMLQQTSESELNKRRDPQNPPILSPSLLKDYQQHVPSRQPEINALEVKKDIGTKTPHKSSSKLFESSVQQALQSDQSQHQYQNQYQNQYHQNQNQNNQNQNSQQEFFTPKRPLPPSSSSVLYQNEYEAPRYVPQDEKSFSWVTPRGAPRVEPFQPPSRPLPSLSEESKEERREKQIYLIKLEKFRLQQIRLTRAFTMEDPLDEIKFEHDMHQNNLKTIEAVNFMTDSVKMGFSGIEFLNNKFGPFIELDGWSSTMTADMGKFKTPLEKLYNRYFRNSEMSPIMEIGAIIIGSMVMHHFKKKLFGSFGGASSRPSRETPISSPDNLPRDTTFNFNPVHHGLHPSSSSTSTSNSSSNSNSVPTNMFFAPSHVSSTAEGTNSNSTASSARRKNLRPSTLFQDNTNEGFSETNPSTSAADRIIQNLNLSHLS